MWCTIWININKISSTNQAGNIEYKYLGRNFQSVKWESIRGFNITGIYFRQFSGVHLFFDTNDSKSTNEILQIFFWLFTIRSLCVYKLSSFMKMYKQLFFNFYHGGKNVKSCELWIRLHYLTFLIKANIIKKNSLTQIIQIINPQGTQLTIL